MKLGPFRKKNTWRGRGRVWLTHLGWLLAQKHGVYLGEVGGEYHLGFHLLGRAFQDNFPERNQELVGMFDASLND